MTGVHTKFKHRVSEIGNRDAIYNELGCGALTEKVKFRKDYFSLHPNHQKITREKNEAKKRAIRIVVIAIVTLPILLLLLAANFYLFIIIAIIIDITLRSRFRGHIMRSALLAGSEKAPDGMRLAENNDYCLFLREFARDDQKLESVLSDSVFGIGPLVALGDPRDGVPSIGGAYRSYVQEDWETAAAQLIDNATLLFLVGSPNTGIRWEINYIKEHGHLEKCVLLPEDFGHTISEGSNEQGFLSLFTPKALQDFYSGARVYRTSRSLGSARWRYLAEFGADFSESDSETMVRCDSAFTDGEVFTGIEVCPKKFRSERQRLSSAVWVAVAETYRKRHH
ncbi:hypothetical protein [Hoeflea sp.]|uniref:hypothetical protein n=1 Tax=Hoeflea sp. TaxID=1940281 RepID=UPI003B01952E